jgi:hypothetical protein
MIHQVIYGPNVKGEDAKEQQINEQDLLYNLRLAAIIIQKLCSIILQPHTTYCLLVQCQAGRPDLKHPLAIPISSSGEPSSPLSVGHPGYIQDKRALAVSSPRPSQIRSIAEA